MLLVVGWRSTRSPRGVLWGATCALGSCFPTIAYVSWQVRRGKISDHRLRIREQRLLPLTLATACTIPTVYIARRFGAPRKVTALVAAMTAGAPVFLLTTRRWKLSLHTASIAGIVVISRLEFGPRALWLSAALPLVVWAKLRLSQHTLTEALSGAALGGAITTLVYGRLR